jgi:hypothetical protein
MLSMSEAGAERNDRSSEASVKRTVMLSFSEPGGEGDDRRSEASRNQGKEPSLCGLPIAEDSVLRLRMTPFLVFS